jgi:hypothetical protein
MNELHLYRNSLCWRSDLRVDLDLRTVMLTGILLSLWAFRFSYNCRSACKDVRGVFIACCIFSRRALIGYVGEAVLKWPLRTAVAWTCALLCGIWYVSRTLRQMKIMSGISHKQLDGAFLKPCMIPCLTTHSRLFLQSILSRIRTYMLVSQLAGTALQGLFHLRKAIQGRRCLG